MYNMYPLLCKYNLKCKKPPKRLRELVGKKIKVISVYDEYFEDVVGEIGTVLSVHPDELYEQWVLETDIQVKYANGFGGFDLSVGDDKYRTIKE